LSRRFGWTDSTDAVKVEFDVAELFDPKDWTMLSHHVVFHGRRVCHARNPACGACPVAQWCPSYGEGEVDPEKARKLLKYELAPGREELLARMMAGETRQELRAAGFPLGA
jgi:endonuclease-3